jgi:hypothetical protein
VRFTDCGTGIASVASIYLDSKVPNSGCYLYGYGTAQLESRRVDKDYAAPYMWKKESIGKFLSRCISTCKLTSGLDVGAKSRDSSEPRTVDEQAGMIMLRVKQIKLKSLTHPTCPPAKQPKSRAGRPGQDGISVG